jgi:3-oxoacyl-[acyl-carrier-protein] synthase II
MTDKRLVITGVGVIAPNGIGRERFFSALAQGLSGIRPVSLFDTAPFRAKLAGEISDFQPQDFLGPKGLRVLDRSTKLAACAVRLALEDAALQVNEDNCRDIGIVMADTLGSVNSICEFDRSALRDGAKYTNPAHFPNTVINSPASHASIKFNIKGFNITLANGFSAGLDAVIYAANLLRQGRAKAALCGGVEELCAETFAGLDKLGLLSAEGRSGGFILGEGACIFVLEEAGEALARKARVLGEIKGYASLFDPQTAEECAVNTAAAERVKGLALQRAGVSEAEEAADSAVKSLIGEAFSAAGAFSLAAGLRAIEGQAAENLLINACGPNGTYSSLIISRPGD